MPLSSLCIRFPKVEQGKGMTTSSFYCIYFMLMMNHDNNSQQMATILRVHPHHVLKMEIGLHLMKRWQE